MKKLLFIILLFASLAGFSQAYVVDTTRGPLQRINNYGLENNNGAYDGFLRIPRDTFKLKQADSGSIVYKGGKLWLWNGRYYINPADIGASLAPVAYSGSYNDLTSKPTIPTNTNQLTNGAGFITSANIAGKLNISDSAAMLAAYRLGLLGKLNLSDTGAMLANYLSLLSLKVKYTDTATMLANYRSGLTSRVLYSDTSAMLAAYRSALNSLAGTGIQSSDTSSMLAAYRTGLLARVRYTDTTSMLSSYQTALNLRALNSAVIKYTDSATMLAAYRTALLLRLKYTDSASMLAAYATALNGRMKFADTASLSARITAISSGSGLQTSDTSAMLSAYRSGLNAKVNVSDTSNMLAAYRSGLLARIRFTDTTTILSAYQTAINLRALNSAVVKYADSSTMLSAYRTALLARMLYSDTSTVLSTYRTALNNRSLVGHTHPFTDITGTAADNQLSSNVALKNINNSFTVDQSIVGKLTTTGTTVFGTTTPATGVAGMWVTSPASNIIQILADNSNSYGLTYQYSSGLFSIFSDYYASAPASDLVIGTYSNRTRQLYFKENGNVGIFTNNPASRLDVNGGSIIRDSLVLSSTRVGSSSDSILTKDPTTKAVKSVGSLSQLQVTNLSDTFSKRIPYTDTISGNTIFTKTQAINKFNSDTTASQFAYRNLNNNFTTSQNVTGNHTITGTYVGAKIEAGIINSFSNVANANLSVGSAAGGIGTVTQTQLLPTSSTSLMYRILERGSITPTAAVSESYIGHMIGNQTVSEAASGTHPLISALYVKPVTVTNAGAATTEAMTVGIEGPMTGVTPTGFNDAFRVKTGNTRVAGLATGFVAKTGAYTIGDNDYTVTADATGGAFTVTLPTAVGIQGRIYVVKKIDNSANAVTVGTTSSQTIDGTTFSLGSKNKFGAFQSDGANWIIIGVN